MIDGKVEIVSKEDGKIDPAQLLKATYETGVSVAELDMIAQGKVIKDTSGSLELEVGPKQSFALDSNDLSKGLEPLVGTPTEVMVRGQLYKKPAGNRKAQGFTQLKLLILEVQKKE